MRIISKDPEASNDTRTVVVLDSDDVEFEECDVEDVYGIGLIRQAIEMAKEQWGEGDLFGSNGNVTVRMCSEDNNPLAIEHEEEGEAILVMPRIE